MTTTYTGTTGNNTFTGDNGIDIFNLWQGGDDTASGSGGNDTFHLRAALTAADQLDGGAGTDTLGLRGDYSAGLIFGDTTIVGIEKLQVNGAYDYNLTENDGNVAAGERLTVNASALGAANFLTFDGSAEMDGHFTLRGGAGNDTLTGGHKSDKFLLDSGGADAAYGGQGEDVFTMGAAFTAADTISGGASHDKVMLDGDYWGANAVTFGPATMTGVETLKLANGYSYDLTTDDATVAAGKTLTVDAIVLGDDNANLAFNGSAETDGSFNIIGADANNIFGGAQADVFNMGTNIEAYGNLHGGGGDDMFYMGPNMGRFNVDGGAGDDTMEFGFRDGSLISVGFDASHTITGVEHIVLTTIGLYFMTTTDATVAAGATLTVDGSAAGDGSIMYFIGSAEQDGSFAITGSAGDDLLTGGQQADSFTGGDGADAFTYTAVGQSTSTTHDTITDFDASVDKFDLDVSVAAYNGQHNSAVTIDSTSFDADLAAASAGFNTANGALIVNAASGGTLGGHIFLIVDVDGDGAYAGGTDYVFDITGATSLGALDSGSFI